MALRGKEKVDKYIYQNLAALEVGARLPAVRNIMRDCQVSQITVQSVLKKYESQKLIQSSNRRGFFKIKNHDNTHSFDELDLIYCPEAQDIDPIMQFHGSFSHYIGKFCGEKWRSVRMHFMEDHIEMSDLRQIVESSKCRTCILVSPPRVEIGEVLRENHVTYVNLLPHSTRLDPYASSIIIDNDKLISYQLQHLIKLGHYKIAYLHLLRPNEAIRDLQMRREAFFKYAMANNLTVKPEWVQFGGYDSDTTMNAMNKILSGSDKPTAIIATDHHLPAIYRALEQHNITPGKDFSVVGTDNLSISKIVSPQATTIDIPVELIARKALEALEATMKDMSYRKVIKVECKLIKRESTQKNHKHSQVLDIEQINREKAFVSI